MSETFPDVRDLYQDIILRHSHAPLHMRKLEPFDAAAKGDNPMCGDRCEVRVRFGRMAAWIRWHSKPAAAPSAWPAPI